MSGEEEKKKKITLFDEKRRSRKLVLAQRNGFQATRMGKHERIQTERWAADQPAGRISSHT